MSPQPVLRPRLAAKALAEHDAMAAWVACIGPVRIPKNETPPFAYLARAICYQQLAGKAAATIHGRVVTALGGEIDPAAILGTPDEVLRGAGLSRNKLAALRDLAERVASGDVVLDGLEDVPDDDVVERLVRVRGIGVWTAQMFLLFRLRRPDVWPAGDLGVRAGYARIHGLSAPPTEKELVPLGEPFRPWRSAAAWYCYRALEVETP